MSKKTVLQEVNDYIKQIREQNAADQEIRPPPIRAIMMPRPGVKARECLEQARREQRQRMAHGRTGTGAPGKERGNRGRGRQGKIKIIDFQSFIKGVGRVLRG